MDLYTMQQLGEQHLDDLRREASAHNASAGMSASRAPIATVRRAAGSMMVRAGARLLGGSVMVVDRCETGLEG